MTKKLVAFLVISLLVSACGAATPSVRLVTATPAPPGATEPAPTEAPPEATATLSGPRATAMALGQSVTLTSPTSTPSLGEVGYVGVVERACTIVEENYVRGDFNGVNWQAVCDEYAERARDVEADQEFYALMDQMIAELDDQHSRFVSPNEFAREFNLPSGGEGRPVTGIEIWPGPAREWEQLHIWRVCERSPAASAGVRKGDILLEVDGEPVTNEQGEFDRSVWAGAIIGAEGSDEVVLTLLQGEGSEPTTLTVGLGGVAGCDGWSHRLISESPRIGYVRIPDFAGNAATNTLDAIEDLESEAPLDGLILDVRHNPGGNSDEAIGIFTTGEFGRIGKLREDATQTIYRIRGPVDWNETTPVALLTDGASHSAAEYFATALKQSDRATLVGMPTAGNTEGITGFNLPGGSLVRLAVQTLQLPDGRTLEGTGVTPDIEVPVGMWGLRERPDVQLQAGYEAITGESLPEAE